MLKKWLQKFSKLKEAFTKTRKGLGDKLSRLFSRPLDEEVLDELEHILYQADLGSQFIEKCTSHMSKYNKKHPQTSAQGCLDEIKAFCLSTLDQPPKEPTSPAPETGPKVILIVGINGSGKTTTIAKLAKKEVNAGRRVLLVAADTFRAAAAKQLSIWAERVGVDCVSSNPGSDPASVVFDGMSAGLSREVDTIIIDTAGRLESKTDLMHEMKKIRSICERKLEGSPHETVLILDATLGQNGLDQVQTFDTYTPITSLIVTKLDGSAKGGIILPIYDKLRLPISFIGIGEGMDDLVAFDKKAYVEALF